MADQLYLSLWFPNFRFDALPASLIGVMRQFAVISKQNRVAAASVYPIDFTEAATYQRIYVNDDRSEDNADSTIENAVTEATEQLHEDMAYEFEMQWKLWAPALVDGDEGLETSWTLAPTNVRIFGFGPDFDDGGYEQNGHIRVDFGLDTPWILEDSELDALTIKHIQQNIEMLLAFTLLVEKHCNISSRLLWTESGEPLAEKLIARLQRLN
jgi:hypothetical protein